MKYSAAPIVCVFVNLSNKPTFVPLSGVMSVDYFNSIVFDRAMVLLYHSPYQVMEDAADPMSLLQGTLDVLVLRALVDGPRHGYAVSRWVRDRTEGALQIEDAPLYKALRRLEQAGCVTAEWGASENNRRARYYRLTPKGRKRLRADDGAWRRYAAAVFRVLGPS